MSSRLGIAGIVLLAAFGLAACGGGGGSGGGDSGMMPEPTEPTEPMEPAGPTAESLKADAADAITAAIAAAMAAAQAEKDAIKYAGMIGTLSVNGDSALAATNAQNVLDAEMAANAAVMDADAALMAAMDAKTAAEALPEDDEERQGAIDAADEAIKQATERKADAMAIVDEEEDTAAGIQSLMGAVAEIEGADMDMPNDAAYHGQQVAMAIGDALQQARVMPRTDSSGRPDPYVGAEENDRQGLTWQELATSLGKEIFWSRIVASGAIVSVRAVLADGEALPTDSQNRDLAALADGATVNSNAFYPVGGGYYKGIAGHLICSGGPCTVADGKLAAGEAGVDPATGTPYQGHWFFAATDSRGPTTYLPASAGDGTYAVESVYARFGYWLTDTGGDITVNTFAANAGTAGTGEVGDSADLVGEATYEGRAVGMSLHKDVDAHGDAVEGSLNSGAFEAQVTLKATFGASPMLGGTIDQFTSVNGGNNVDSGWSVMLKETAFTDAAVSAGVANASGQDGAWSATGYGDGDARPTGIYGTFNAHFTDGHAAGAYATRKAE